MNIPEVGQVFIILRTDTYRRFSRTNRYIKILEVSDKRITYDYFGDFRNDRTFSEWEGALEDGTIVQATPLLEALL